MKRKIIYTNQWKNSDIPHFSALLSDLLQAGIPLIESLKIIADQYRSRKRNQILQVVQMIEGGNSVSSAFQSIQFPNIFLALIGIAELHGKLSDTLASISNWFKRRDEFQKRLFKKLAYPIFLFLFATFILIFFFFVLFPRFHELLSNFGTDLPQSTKLLINIQSFLSKHWIDLLIIFLSGAIICLIIFKWLSKREKLIPFLLKVPLIKTYLQIRFTFFITSQLGLLLQAGMGIWDAILEIQRFIPYQGVRIPLNEMLHHILAGKPLSSLHLTSSILHKEFYRLTSIGEKRGMLGSQLMLCSYLMEQITESYLQFFIRWTEPTLLLMIGGMISILILALFTPIINLLQVM